MLDWHTCPKGRERIEYRTFPFTYLLDNRQNPWLGIIISISSNTQIDLLRERIRLIGSGQLEDPEQLVSVCSSHSEDSRDAYASGGARGTSSHRSAVP